MKRQAIPSRPVALVMFAIFCLVLAPAWSGGGQSPGAGEPAKAPQSGKLSRLRHGLARPFASGDAKKAAESDAKTSATAPAAAARPAARAEVKDDYIIGRDDVLAINVWQEPQVSRTVAVRPDGKISIPLAGEVEATGLTPLKLQARITELLKAYLSNPEVTVIVEKVILPKFNILGEVQRPGAYDVAKGMRVLDAIAVAGGFREFAKLKEVYVLRRTASGTPAHLPFNYKEIMKGRNFEQNIALEPGDTVVVP